MSIALERGIAPVSAMLRAAETEDLAFQEPGAGWWLHHGAWHRVEVPEMTYARMHGIAVMAAAQTRQEITHRSPILTADLPGELRLEAVMPPVQMPGTMALTFRRVDKELDEIEAMPSLYDTSRWNQWADRKQRMQARDALLLTHYDAGDIISFHKELAKARKTGLFCGATGAGKTRLSKMLGGAIPLHERIIAIEDARELVIRQPNHVRHFYSGGDSGVRPAKLLKTTLRERPDRVLLAEMRDPEAAAVFISDVMAGHPGSLSTIHGGYPGEAARRLVDLLSDGKTTGVETIIAQLEAAIDFIIPVENDGGIRSIGAIWFRADAARRGETFRDLLKDVQ